MTNTKDNKHILNNILLYKRYIGDQEIAPMPPYNYGTKKNFAISSMSFQGETVYYTSFSTGDKVCMRVLDSSGDISSLAGFRYGFANATPSEFGLTKATASGPHWTRSFRFLYDGTSQIGVPAYGYNRIQNDMLPAGETPSDGIWYAEIVAYYTPETFRNLPMNTASLYFTSAPTEYSQLRVTYSGGVPTLCEFLDNDFCSGYLSPSRFITSSDYALSTISNSIDGNNNWTLIQSITFNNSATPENLDFTITGNLIATGGGSIIVKNQNNYTVATRSLSSGSSLAGTYNLTLQEGLGTYWTVTLTANSIISSGSVTATVSNITGTITA